MVDKQRRAILKRTATAAGLISLAGCNSGSESPKQSATTDPTASNSTTPQSTKSNSDTQLGEFQHTRADILPIITETTRENQTRSEVTVTDQDGLKTIEIYLDNRSLDEPVQVHQENLGGEVEAIAAYEFPQRMVAPGENRFGVRVTDETGRTQDFTETFTPDTREWKVDTPYSEYSTERSWDDLNFQQEEMEERRQGWLQQMTYNDLIEELKQDTEQVNEKYSDEGDIISFPNATENSEGHWDTEDFRNTNKTQEILLYGNGVLSQHALKNLRITAWSGENDHFAATHQTLANHVHEEDGRQRNVETTHVNEGGHGTVIAYSDPDKLDNEFEILGENYGEHTWWYVDTTDDWVVPLGVTAENGNGNTIAENIQRGTYNPFTQGYQGDEQAAFDYEREKIKAVGPLVSFVDRSKDQNIDLNKVSISDPVLENIYNEHVPEGESVDPIIDMVMKAGQKQIETGEHIQIYGDELQYNQESEVFEGVEYAVNNGVLHEHSMEEKTAVTAEHVNQYLEGRAAV
ncbi:hypothetical protein [Halostella pelagica]|uniref:hypothetical protein n=1 Tax=Halostella pelagica TaxID=2583824 RepID=UPI0010820770|nr:hypothetical protein [Halostella pelagica]